MVLNTELLYEEDFLEGWVNNHDHYHNKKVSYTSTSEVTTTLRSYH